MYSSCIWFVVEPMLICSERLLPLGRILLIILLIVVGTSMILLPLRRILLVRILLVKILMAVRTRMLLPLRRIGRILLAVRTRMLLLLLRRIGRIVILTVIVVGTSRLVYCACLRGWNTIVIRSRCLY
jgi:hypothetical protein